MKNIIFLFAALLITVTSCRKDIQEDDTIFIPIGEDVTTNLHGRVVDAEGRSISEASVTVKDQTVFTNGDGYFYMPVISVPSDGFTINVQSLNNEKTLKRVVPQSKTNTYEEIILDRAERFKEYSATIENIIQDSIGQVRVTIPENSIVTENNTPYDGIYLARVKYFNPTQVTTLRTMPGNMQGIDSEGNKVTLGSFGMIDIEITDPNGVQSLSLSPGKKAFVQMIVPGVLLENIPETIPTWSLDEISGLWLEENETTDLTFNQAGGFGYLFFNIEEFKIWNCDIKELNTNLTGTILDQFGLPIENRLIQLTFSSNNQEFFCTGGNTNSKGEYNTLVPKGIPLILSLYDYNCEDIIYTEEIGAFSENINSKDITAIISEDTYTITGFAYDCNGDISFNNATVFLYDLNDKVIISTQTSEDGGFTLHNTCFDTSLEEGYRIGVLDLDSGNYIITDQLPLTEIDTDIGNVFPCDELDEYIDIVSGFGDLLFDDSNTTFDGDSLYITAGPNGFSFSLFASITDEGINQISYLQVKYSEDQVLTCTSQYQHTVCSEAVTLDIKEINVDLKYITGTIVGILYFGEIAEPGFTDSSDVAIEFRVNYQ